MSTRMSPLGFLCDGNLEDQKQHGHIRRCSCNVTVMIQADIRYVVR